MWWNIGKTSKNVRGIKVFDKTFCRNEKKKMNENAIFDNSVKSAKTFIFILKPYRPNFEMFKNYILLNEYLNYNRSYSWTRFCKTQLHFF